MTEQRFRVYAGSVGGERALAALREFDMGRLVTPFAWKAPVPDVPWCLDNGAFACAMTGRPFPEREFASLLADEWGDPGKVFTRSCAVREADFGVCPCGTEHGLLAETTLGAGQMHSMIALTVQVSAA